MQSAISSTCVQLSNSLDLSITNVYMNVNAETYNTVCIQKIKSFVFANDKIKNLKETCDKVITIFCYLPVDKTRNFYKSAM